MGLDIFTHILEQVLRQFRYLQGIPRNPEVVALAIVFHRVIDAIYADYHERLVLEGDPSRTANQELLEEEQVRTNHFMDVLSICYHIIALGRYA